MAWRSLFTAHPCAGVRRIATQPAAVQKRQRVAGAYSAVAGTAGVCRLVSKSFGRFLSTPRGGDPGGNGSSLAISAIRCESAQVPYFGGRAGLAQFLGRFLPPDWALTTRAPFFSEAVEAACGRSTPRWGVPEAVATTASVATGPGLSRRRSTPCVFQPPP